MGRLVLALALLACTGEKPTPATERAAVGCNASPGAAGLGAAAALIATLAALRLARRS